MHALAIAVRFSQTRLRSILILTSILMALAGSAPVSGQPALTSVVGVVVDRQGSPIQGATVTLEGQGQTRTTTTDQQGRFRFAAITTGDYQLRAKGPGSALAAQTAHVVLGRAQRFTLVLGPSKSLAIPIIREVPHPSPPPTISHAPFPGTTPPPVPKMAKKATKPDQPFTIVRVFYGTDRQMVSSEDTGFDYTGDRSSTLALGSSTVSIPKDHRLGEWEKPTIFTFTPDQEQNVILLSVTPHPQAEFLRRLQQRVQQSAGKEAFVFVHGYNVSFSDAVQRTAILAYDLQFDGAPIAFSWPSRGDAAMYLADEQSVEFSVPDLERFLTLVAKNSGATKIHLIAHSMGNRALLRALSNLQEAGHAPANLAEAVLTAPDVDRDIFTQLVTAITSVALHTTLYASSRDKALRASHDVHDGPRAGEGGTSILLTDGVDSIDVSALDTGFLSHSYFADNRTVVTDLFDLLHTEHTPDERVCLSPRERANHKFWVFDQCDPQ